MNFAGQIGKKEKRSLHNCRDRGRRGVDAGASCLSSLGYDPLASLDLTESCGEKDKHKAPTLPHIHPLSLQIRGRKRPTASNHPTSLSRIQSACWGRCL